MNVGTAPVEPEEETDIKEIIKAAKIQKRWVEEIRLYEKKSEPWETKGKKILRRYKDERSPREQNVPRFNILWSNVQTLKPSLFAKNPKPDIERRYRDKDVLGRISSQVLERAITYYMNEQFDTAVSQSVIDRLLPGRGTVWARYEPHFKDSEVNENEDVADEGEQITDDVESYASHETLDNETVCWDYVHWQDFGHTFGRVWEEVDAGWRKVYLTRDELIDRFGEEIGKQIQLDYSPHDLKDDKLQEIEKKATIYEIWCKSDKKVYWIHKDYISGPLDMQDDPLGLEGFFPFPKPLFATLANDTCIPVSDYQEYQDQANELDTLTSRIGAITKAVKVAGIYDASAEGIERLLSEGVENQLVPVKQAAILTEKGGLSGVMQLMPMQEILQTLLGLYDARDKVKQDLYEITGIADIIRGASDPDETYGAQRIKSQFGTLRLSASQDDVQRFARDLIRIGTQIIAQHFSIDTIKKICGMQLFTQQEKIMIQASQQPPPQMQGQPQQPSPLPPQFASIDPEDMQEMMEEPSWEEVEALLRDEIMLSYKIDIETDSTIKFDEMQEQQSRMDFLKVSGDFLQQAAQNQNPELEPLLIKMLQFGIRGFKVGKELEQAFEVAAEKVQKDASDPSKKKPDPAMAKIQADMQVEQQKSQDEMKRLQMQAQVDAHQGQVDSEVDKFRIQQEGQIEMAKAKLQSETSIIVAKIGAGAKTDGSDPSIPSVNPEAQTVGPSMNELMATVIQQMQQTLSGMQQSHQAMVQAMSKPKQVVRDPVTDKIIGVQ